MAIRRLFTLVVTLFFLQAALASAQTISSVSIPDSAHKVGDTVTATIKVDADIDNYTTGSGGVDGTIHSYALSGLSKINDTTYAATFTVIDDGFITDVAAANDIAVDFTVTNSSGTSSAAFTTAISQPNDAIFAKLPVVTLTKGASTIAEDGGVSVLTATLTNSLNNQWPADVTVNLAYTGTATPGTDFSKSDSIVIGAGSSSNTASVTSIADTHYDATSAETIIVDISSLSEGNEGAPNQQSIFIVDAEMPPTIVLSVGSTPIAEDGGTSTITAALSHPTFEDVTVNLGYTGTATGGGTDYATPSASITIPGLALNADAVTGITAIDDGDSDGDLNIVIDVTSVTGGSATENGTQQQTITITDDEPISLPNITAVSIADSPHKVGDVVVATITVTTDPDNYTTGGGGLSGTINGYAVGSLSKTNDTTYRATFTVTDGGTDVAAVNNVAVNLIMDDSGGDPSPTFTTPIVQASDAIFANLPDVTLTADTNTIAEDGGVSVLTATLLNSLGNQWPMPVTVGLAYIGTATAVTDYTKSDSIVIDVGTSSNTANVTGVDDDFIDGPIAETVIVDISSLSVGNEIPPNFQIISITDAESLPTVSLSVSNNSISEDGGMATITATLNNPTLTDVTVNLVYAGTAVGGGTDYNTPSASIFIPALAASADAVTGIIAIDNTAEDGSLTVIVDISSVSGSDAVEDGIQSVTITIIDDDAVETLEEKVARLAADLPPLTTEDAAGNPSSASIQGGVSADGGITFFSDAVFSVPEEIEITLLISPEAEHLGEPALIIVAVISLSDPSTIVMLGSAGQLVAYNGSNLVAFSEITLEEANIVDVTGGIPIPLTSDLIGTFQIHVGYMVISTGVIVYNVDPIVLEVAE